MRNFALYVSRFITFYIPQLNFHLHLKEVIKTFLIDTPVMVILGMLYTPLERELGKPFYRAKTFWASCRLAALFLTLALAGYVFYPDWMWMYFVSTKALGLVVQLAIIGYLVLSLYVLPFLAGYFGGINFRENKMLWWGAVILNLAIEALLIIALWNRYSALGTREEFLQGNVTSLADFHLFSALLNIGAILLAILAVWQWRRLRTRQGTLRCF